MGEARVYKKGKQSPIKDHFRPVWILIFSTLSIAMIQYCWAESPTYILFASDQTGQKKYKPIARFFKWWEQVDVTRTGINEIVNKRVIDFLVLLIASDNNF